MSQSDTLTQRFTVIFPDWPPFVRWAKRERYWCNKFLGCLRRRLVNLPVPGAFEPVEDVGAPRVVDLVERVRVRLLDGHSIA